MLLTTLASILLRYLFLKSNIDILDVISNTRLSFSCLFSINMFRCGVRNLLEEFFLDKSSIKHESGYLLSSSSNPQGASNNSGGGPSGGNPEGPRPNTSN